MAMIHSLIARRRFGPQTQCRLLPGVPHMGYTYLNLLDSPELLQILVTLTTVIKPVLPKLLRQGYRYFKLRKAFSKFYRRHSVLVEKYSVSLKTILQQGISEPECYGDLVYRFRKIVGNFSEQFRKIFNRYKNYLLLPGYYATDPRPPPHPPPPPHTHTHTHTPRRWFTLLAVLMR